MLFLFRRFSTQDFSAMSCTFVDVVKAYLSNNVVPPSEIPNVIRTIYEGLTNGVSAVSESPAAEPLRPAVPIKKAVSHDAVICLECGEKGKMLKRHLHSAHGLTPGEYRTKWGLPSDFPMVAPAYAKARSELAVKLGLGQGNRGRVQES